MASNSVGDSSQSAAINQHTSPPPPAPPAHISMTPPPSSQPPAQPLSTTIARTPTPHSHLSSPPPTHKPLPSTAAPASSQPTSDLYTQDAVDSASADELRNMLASVSAAQREAKASAASLKLQYNLLLMEKTEAMARKDVELDMALKEVQVVRAREASSSVSAPSPSASTLQSAQLASAHAQYTANLHARIQALEAETSALHRRLDDMRTASRDRESALIEEIERLRDRIRANRKHVNLLRSSSVASDGAPSALSTPMAPSRKTDAFSQLLLADQVLSQEASAPTTPQPRNGRRTNPHGHTRAVHSLSSLPATPLQAQSVPPRARASAYYYTPTHPRPRSPVAPQTAPAARTRNSQNTELFRRRRRESRDSTISASEPDVDADLAVGEEDLTDREDVPESQASQEARRILTSSASSSAAAPQSQSQSQSRDHVPRSSGLLQATLYGAVSRPTTGAVASKRKASREVPGDSYGAATAAKKARGASEGVGLGIGGWTSPSPSPAASKRPV